jgi:hypothetical protein|tara:strand:+ start:537 stop:1115 length:579 start_codon:yes stop_codon:yes gene_type:complete
LSIELDTLFADLLSNQEQSSASMPPVHLWKPQLSGDMDLLIDREGRWIHEGGEIKRPAMVKLFASILVYEEGDYFLITPVEKWRIKVEVAPLFVIAAERETRDGSQAIKLTTRTGDIVVVDSQHPLSMQPFPGSAEPLPLVLIRRNLQALLSRNVFYQIVEWAAEISDDQNTSETHELSISSMGSVFVLGRF